MADDCLADRCKLPLLWLAFLVLQVTAGRAIAAKPAVDLLPAATKFCWSVAHEQEYSKRFHATQLGGLLSDPAVQPFLDDLPRQMREEASNHPLSVLWIDLGIESDDVEDLTEGEVAWAVVHADGETPARVLLANVTGRAEQTEALLAKIDAAMAKEQARKDEIEIAGTPVTRFDLPPAGQYARRSLFYCQRDGELVCADSESILKVLLQNLDSDSSEVLSRQPGYQQVIKRCQASAGDQSPDATLYLVPVDLMAALQQLAPEPDERTVENLRIARKHNFDAISAVGGLLTVGQGEFDFHLRLAIYAPKPWQNGMRVCNLPNATMKLPAWVRGDNDSLMLLNVDFQEFSKYFGPLFDDVYGEGEEGLYEDLKNSLKEDPAGAQIDVDQEVYAKLSPQTVLLSRDVLPVTPNSPQRLIAYATTDEAALAATVSKAMEADSNVEMQEIAGHKAYFSYTVEEGDGFSDSLLEPERSEEPSFITCVANGHLMFATDAQILEDAIAGGESMVDSVDLQAAGSYWKPLGKERCLEYFARLGPAVHVDYELFRQGRKPLAGKSFKGLLNNIAMGEPPAINEPEFDGSKLPPFEQVQQHFGLAALAGVATDDGWYLEGFILKKQ
ncbi:DUF3352 domain-containing protein [Aeoliella sp. ICT_H6.2]|uniref:DUF3352 domain-containing protein n=1 Tax=Aeoliella straminimaris TaxID=2954799 RepID=A0A9X2F5B3_9BACT|nr:DUF3352 domain-containing protein [Aeoliella straminimaris]MCO6042527.1 DUF3352 domain-containing protein [Aeoliella straminimaris]